MAVKRARQAWTAVMATDGATGLTEPKPRRLKLTPPKPTEAQVQAAILRYLAVDKRVVWHARMNSGKGWFRPHKAIEERWMRFGFPGCPDILGQLGDGRYLAVEVKAPGGKRREEQVAHIAMAQAAGAVALFAESVDAVRRAIDSHYEDKV